MSLDSQIKWSLIKLQFWGWMLVLAKPMLIIAPLAGLNTYLDILDRCGPILESLNKQLKKRAAIQSNQVEA